MRTLLCTLLAMSSLAQAANWPNLRGPNQNGSSNEKNLPAKFDRTQNVRWAADLPGLSASEPIVWDDKVFITALIEASK